MDTIHAEHGAEARLREACELLSEHDMRLAWLFQTQGTPPLWSRPPTFATLVQIILEQQVSLASAAAIYQRLQQQVAAITATHILNGGEEVLRHSGLTRQKTRYCLALAQAVSSGQLHLDDLARLPDTEVMQQLTQINGIGPWTARVFLLMGLGRMDIWPQGDLALNNAARSLHGWTARKTDRGIAHHATRWKPYRSVAARLIWQHYLNGMPSPPALRF